MSVTASSASRLPAKKRQWESESDTDDQAVSADNGSGEEFGSLSDGPSYGDGSGSEEEGPGDVASDDDAGLGDGGSEDEEGLGDEGSGDDAGAKSGWADALGRVLSRKAPPLRDSALIKRKQQTEADSGKMSRKQLARLRRKHTEWELQGRRKVDILDKDREKKLNRIATRGVVQLFNAVRQHQSSLSDQLDAAGGSTIKTERVLAGVSKQQLLERLGADCEQQLSSNSCVEPAAGHTAASGGWNVLNREPIRDVSMKDWIRADNADQSDEEELTSDADSDISGGQQSD